MTDSAGAGVSPAVGPGDVIDLSGRKDGKATVVDDRTGDELRVIEGMTGDRAETSDGLVAYVALIGTERQLRIDKAR